MPFFSKSKIFLRALLTIGFLSNIQASAIKGSSSNRLTRELTADDLIVFGDGGRVEVVSRKEYITNKHIPIATARQHYNNFSIAEDEESKRSIEKRCQRQKVITMNPVETFLNWDVPMSAVVFAPPNDTASVSIEEGHWVGEKLSVSTGSKVRIIKEFMDQTLGLSYDKSWTTEISTKYSFTVPSGKFGAIVSNPLTTRHSGWMDVGCIGRSERVKFSGDSYRGMVFMEMPWVEGVIGLCLSDTYPLKRCLGHGTL